MFWANTLTITQDQLRDWQRKLQAIRKKRADMVLHSLEVLLAGCSCILLLSSIDHDQHVQYRKLSHRLNPSAHRLLDALRAVAAVLQRDVAHFSRKFGGSSQEIMELTNRGSSLRSSFVLFSACLQ